MADQEHARALLELAVLVDLVGNEPVQHRIDHRRRKLRPAVDLGRRQPQERFPFHALSRLGLPSRALDTRSFGKVSRTTVPLPSSLSSFSVPPWISTMALTSARPRPVPS